MNELRQHHLTPLILAAQEDYNFAFIGKYSRSHEGFAFYCVKHSTCFQWLNVQRLAGSIHDLVVQDTEVLSHYPEVLQADHRLFTQNMSDGLKAFLPRQVQDTLRSQPDFVPRGLVPLVQALLQRGKPGPQLELPEVFAARKAATLAADAISVSMQSSMSGMSIDGNNYHGQHGDEDDEAEADGMSLAGASYNAGNVPSGLGLPPVHGGTPSQASFNFLNVGAAPAPMGAAPAPMPDAAHSSSNYGAPAPLYNNALNQASLHHPASPSHRTVAPFPQAAQVPANQPYAQVPEAPSSNYGRGSPGGRPLPLSHAQATRLSAPADPRYASPTHLSFNVGSGGRAGASTGRSSGRASSNSRRTQSSIRSAQSLGGALSGSRDVPVQLGSHHTEGSPGSASLYEHPESSSTNLTKKRRYEGNFVEQKSVAPSTIDLSQHEVVTDELVRTHLDVPFTSFAAYTARDADALVTAQRGDAPSIKIALKALTVEEGSGLIDNMIASGTLDNFTCKKVNIVAEEISDALPGATSHVQTYERELEFCKRVTNHKLKTMKAKVEEDDRDLAEAIKALQDKHAIEKRKKEEIIQEQKDRLAVIKKQEVVVKEADKYVRQTDLRLTLLNKVVNCSNRNGDTFEAICKELLLADDKGALALNSKDHDRFSAEARKKHKLDVGNLVGLDIGVDMSDDVTKLTEHSADYIGKAPDGSELNDGPARDEGKAAGAEHRILNGPYEETNPVPPKQSQPAAHEASVEATAKDESVKAAPSVGPLPNMDLSIAATVSGSQALSASLGSVRSMSLPPPPAPQAAPKGAATKLPPSHQQAANPSDASSLMDMTGLTTEAGSTAVSGSLGEVDSVSMPSLPPAPAPQVAPEGAATKLPPSHQPPTEAEAKTPRDESSLFSFSTTGADVPSLGSEI